jgi:hypothetical protein
MPDQFVFFDTKKRGVVYEAGVGAGGRSQCIYRVRCDDENVVMQVYTQTGNSPKKIATVVSGESVDILATNIWVEADPSSSGVSAPFKCYYEFVACVGQV